MVEAIGLSPQPTAIECVCVCVCVRERERERERREGTPERRRREKMAFTMRTVKVSPNSASLAEARSRVIDFFKTACRSIPKIMEIYNLHDVVTVSQLRSTISSEIRKNAHLSNPKVIDMLLFKGMEELGNIVEHAKQRHHIIGQYVVGREGLVHDRNMEDQGTSEFLKRFYTSNYF